MPICNKHLSSLGKGFALYGIMRNYARRAESDVSGDLGSARIQPIMATNCTRLGNIPTSTNDDAHLVDLENLARGKHTQKFG